LARSEAVRQIAMGFDVIGPTLGCLAIAFAIGLGFDRVGGAIERVGGAIERAAESRHERLGDALIAAGDKFKKPKK
jgi:hypothetical protein